MSKANKNLMNNDHAKNYSAYSFNNSDDAYFVPLA